MIAPAPRVPVQPSRRFRGDGGTALIEFCVVMPLLLVVIAGIIDCGMLLRQSAALAGTLQTTARVAATSGARRSADFLALRAFMAGIVTTRNVVITKVVIFQPVAEGSSQPMSSSCLGAAAPPPSAKCNVYTGGQVAALGMDSTVHFGPDAATCGTTAWDANWCPTSRNDRADGPPDWLGVYAEVRFRPFSGLWMAGGLTMPDREVVRLEPRTVAA